MIMQPETGKLSVREKIGYSPGDGAIAVLFLATDLLNIKRCVNKKIFLEDFLQNRLIGYIWSFQECFSFSRLLTSSIVPLNGPGVSILIDTRAAANFNDSGTS
jgi:hypothetical protein